MSTIKLILNDGNREAVLTPGSEAGTLVIENTQNDSRSKLWRSEETSALAATEQTASGVMAVTINGHGGLVLGDTNLTTDATVTAVMKNGMSGVKNITLETLGENLDGTTTWWAFFYDGPIDTYELTISDPTNVDGYIDIPQIICGPAIAFEYGAKAGTVIQYLEDVEHLITDALSIRSEGTGQKKRLATLDPRLISATERAAIVDTIKNAGRAYSGFVSIYDDWGGALEAAGAFICKRLDDFEFDHWLGPAGTLQNRFQSRLQLREV